MKDEKNKKTVQLLCNVMRSLMAQKEIEKITINDITSLAKLHRITFYYYFQDKYELLHYIFYEDIEKVVHQCESENILGFIIGFLKYLSDNKKLYNNAFESNDYQSLKNVYLHSTKIYFEKIINDLSDEESLKVDKTTIVDFYSMAATAYIINWLKVSNGDNYEEAAQKLVYMIEDGFMSIIGG